jgi:hypothetical protein
MNTAENNKLIAEFMGYKLFGGNKYCIDAHPQKRFVHKGLLNESVDFTPEQMQFHTSWEWLMPVVRKIVELSCNDNDDAFLSNEYTNILEIIPLAIREDSYKVVVEFIKWYNENK